MKTTLRLVAAVSVLAVITTYASSFTPGDIVIYRVGDGTAALSTTTAAVFLDEYSPLGTLVQSIPLTTSGSGVITAVGNASTEGILTRSQDGEKLIFTGYQIATGSSSATAFAANKVIGVVGLSGVANTSSYSVSDAGATSIRSATSTDGSSLFYTSSASSVRYVSTPGLGATSTAIDARNSRQVTLSGNKLFASNGSTAITGKVQDYGLLPTATTTANPDAVLRTSDAVNGFVLFDLNPSVAGVDTMYFLSTVAGQLMKATFNGTSWSTNSGVISTTAQNITGYKDDSGVHLFLTTTSSLLTTTDTSGYNGPINGGSLTTLASVASNEAFRGLSMIPEPSTVALIGLGVAGLVAFRRRNS